LGNSESLFSAEATGAREHGHFGRVKVKRVGQVKGKVFLPRFEGGRWVKRGERGL